MMHKHEALPYLHNKDNYVLPGNDEKIRDADSAQLFFHIELRIDLHGEKKSLRYFTERENKMFLVPLERKSKKVY